MLKMFLSKWTIPKMNDYWIPKSKFQLSAWLSDYYKEPMVKFERMRKDRLYAIFHKTRRKIDKERRLLNEVI